MLVLFSDGIRVHTPSLLSNFHSIRTEKSFAGHRAKDFFSNFYNRIVLFSIFNPRRPSPIQIRKFRIELIRVTGNHGNLRNQNKAY